MDPPVSLPKNSVKSVKCRPSVGKLSVLPRLICKDFSAESYIPTSTLVSPSLWGIPKNNLWTIFIFVVVNSGKNPQNLFFIRNSEAHFSMDFSSVDSGIKESADPSCIGTTI